MDVLGGLRNLRQTKPSDPLLSIYTCKLKGMSGQHTPYDFRLGAFSGKVIY